MQSQKQRFFPSFVTYSECLLVAILTFSYVLCFFKDERERVYSTISLGIKRGKGNKIENHKKILSKWRNLVSNSSGKWKKALKSHFWQAGTRQPHVSLEFLETIRVVSLRETQNDVWKTLFVSLSRLNRVRVNYIITWNMPTFSFIQNLSHDYLFKQGVW